MHLTGATSEEVTRRISPGSSPIARSARSRSAGWSSSGPRVGRELQLQALYAVLTGLVCITLYIAFRFDLKGGVACDRRGLCDVLVSLGALSLADREFSEAVLAGLLLIGYSVNDTIVAYDRLRENRPSSPPRARRSRSR